MELTRFQQWIGAWCGLVDNLVCLFTLGYYYPNLWLKYYRFKLNQYVKKAENQ